MLTNSIIAEGFCSFDPASAKAKKDIAAKYANELAHASFFRRSLIRFLIWREVVTRSKPRKRSLRNLYGIK